MLIQKCCLCFVPIPDVMGVFEELLLYVSKTKCVRLNRSLEALAKNYANLKQTDFFHGVKCNLEAQFL